MLEVDSMSEKMLILTPSHQDDLSLFAHGRLGQN
jgi:hypothetical protein